MPLPQILDKAVRGAHYPWAEVVSYEKYDMVLASNGKPYIAIEPSGPGSEIGSLDPTNDVDHSAWRLAPAVGDGFAEVNWSLVAPAKRGDELRLPVSGATQITYTMGMGMLHVFADGVSLIKGIDYEELTNESIKILINLPAGTRMHVIIHGYSEQEASLPQLVVGIDEGGNEYQVSGDAEDIENSDVYGS